MRFVMLFCSLLFVLTPSTAQHTDVITPENVHQLEQIGVLGQGETYQANYVDDNTLITLTDAGLWSYDTRQLSAPPHVRQLPISHYVYGLGWFTFESLPRPSRVAASPEMAAAGNEIVRLDSTGRFIVYRNSETYQVILWNGFSNRVQLVIDSGDLYFFAMGNTLLAVQESDQTSFYDIVTGEMRFSMSPRISYFSPGGSAAVQIDQIPGERHVVIVTDVPSQQEILRVTLPQGEFVADAVFNTDGSRLAIARVDPIEGTEAIISVWNVRTGEQIGLFKHSTRLGTIQMVFSPDSQYLLVYGRWFFDTEELIQVYNLTNGSIQFSRWESRRRSVTAGAFSQDSQHFALVRADGYIEIFKVERGSREATALGYPGYVVEAFFTNDGILTTNDENETYFWDTGSFRRQAIYNRCVLLAYHEASDTALCKQRIPARYAIDYETIIRHLTTGEIIVTVPIEDTLGERFAFIITAAFHPDGHEIAIVDNKGSVYIMDSATGEIKQTLREETDQSKITFALQYTEDGRYLAAGDAGTVWETETYEVVVQPEIDPAWHSNLTISEAGDWYALPSRDGHIYVWRWNDLLDGMSATPDTALAAIAYEYAYQFAYTAGSPDGHLLAVTFWDTVKFFDTQTFEQVHQMPFSGNLLRFSPDGRLLITGTGYCYCGAADESYQVGYAQVWGLRG